MRRKYWLFISLLVVLVPCYTLTPAAADLAYDYIGLEYMYYANLAYYAASPTSYLSERSLCRPFYTHGNETLLLFIQEATLAGSGVATQDVNSQQAMNGTLYLITTRDLDHFWQGEPHEKLVIAYAPRVFTTHSIVIPSEDLYIILALSNYTSGSQYQEFGITTAHIYLLLYGYGGTNITTVNYNTENINNTNNAYTTVHERAVVTWADAGLIAMICATVIGVVLLRRRR